MDNAVLTPASAMRALNAFKLIKSETKDGFITIRKVSKTSYEIKVFTYNHVSPVVMQGTIKNVMKTFNGSNINKGFYIE